MIEVSEVWILSTSHQITVVYFDIDRLKREKHIMTGGAMVCNGFIKYH